MWYDLKLNETFKIDDYCFVRRVPGGWTLTETGISQSTVRIPYSEEFKRVVK
jgi:hypothetical protein